MMFPFFKHYPEVEHLDGSKEMKYADRRCANCGWRPIAAMNKISRAVEENGRSYGGFNVFHDDDQELFESLLRGEFNISGFQSRNLRCRLKGKTSSQISRLLKRLRVHGLIKKIGKTYKYYLTSLGKQVITLGLRLKQLHIIPQLSPATAD